MVVIEDLKRVKNGKRGTFSRKMNRRLSHWQYAYAADLLERRCEIEGVRLKGKTPGRLRSIVRLAVNGTNEIAEAISFFVSFVVIPIMPTSKLQRLLSYWDWRECMVSVRYQA